MPGKTNVELENKIETALDAMKMSIEQEDYNEFFELYGDIYCELSDKFTEAVNNKTNEVDTLYSLIYDVLIPDSVDLMKETWIMTN